MSAPSITATQTLHFRQIPQSSCRQLRLDRIVSGNKVSLQLRSESIIASTRRSHANPKPTPVNGRQDIHRQWFTPEADELVGLL